jgi:hypothetical protein
MRKGFKKFTSIMPCSRKANGKKGCDYELMAFRSNLENGTIHVYAHSQHNHILISEGNN